MFLKNVVKFRGIFGRDLKVPWACKSKLCKRVRFGIHGLDPGQFRSYATCPLGIKVTICGAAGCTGQPLALLLKQCPLIDELSLYDHCATCGFGLELSHVDTKCVISSYSGTHMLSDALKPKCIAASCLSAHDIKYKKLDPFYRSMRVFYNENQGSHVVVVVARNGIDTFEANAPALTEIALHISSVCPKAFTIVATEPVESMVPLVAEIFRLRNMYNPRALLGCVELHCVRANTVLSDYLRVPPEGVRVPVIGGTSPCTMVPVLSSACHPGNMTQEQVECVTSCIMNGNDTVSEASGDCAATPCLAGSYAIARVTINVIKAMQGAKITQCAYVDSLEQCAPDTQFFSSDVILGPGGVETNLGVPELTKFENCLLCNCLPYVRNEQARACWLVYSMCQSCCSPRCYVHPSTPQPPMYPCVPPSYWNGKKDCEKCVDDYLISICREMVPKCGIPELCWRPRRDDFDQGRANQNGPNQSPQLGGVCPSTELPRSVKMQQIMIQNAQNPYNKC